MNFILCLLLSISSDASLLPPLHLHRASFSKRRMRYDSYSSYCNAVAEDEEGVLTDELVKAGADTDLETGPVLAHTAMCARNFPPSRHL